MVADESAPQPLRRRRSGKVLAGVAGGIADHLGVGLLPVRAAFAMFAGFAGAGIAAYGLLWIVVRPEPADAPAHEHSARERQQALVLMVLGFAVVVALASASSTLGGWVVVPLGIALVGVALVWREADGRGRGSFSRVLAGMILAVLGIGAALSFALNLGVLPFTLLAVLAALAGVALLAAPWWLRLTRDLGEEHRARIRVEERAEIAAHLHDSVLQTLALIQKQSDIPSEVHRLARSQERELRGWLYGPEGYRPRGAGTPGSPHAPAAQRSLSSAMAAVAAEVEDSFAITIERVVVGEAEVRGPLVALIPAAKEAMVNAAKHAGVATVSVYAEVEPGQVTVFVRDRGRGFDSAAVQPDRHGLADSVRSRLSRNGGTATLRTAPGEGTEVMLSMPIAHLVREVP